MPEVRVKSMCQLDAVHLIHSLIVSLNFKRQLPDIHERVSLASQHRVR